MKILFRGQRKRHGYLQLPSFFRNHLSHNNPLSQIIEDELNSQERTTIFSPWNILKNSDSIKKTIRDNNFFERNRDHETNLRHIHSKTITDFLGGSFAQIKRNTQEIRLLNIPNMLAWESILQHYGMKTRWLDVVDNLIIALWFVNQNFSDHIKMNRSDVHNLSTYKLNDNNRYGYLFIYGVVAPTQIAKGVWDGSNLRMVNLAEATNSHTLRPHMQYAHSFFDKRIPSIINNRVFCSEKPIEMLNSFDYSKFLLCIIQLEHEIVNKWLCSEDKKGKMRLPHLLAFQSLFPSPMEDYFFRVLHFHHKSTSITYFNADSDPTLGYSFQYSSQENNKTKNPFSYDQEPFSSENNQ